MFGGHVARLNGNIETEQAVPFSAYPFLVSGGPCNTPAVSDQGPSSFDKRILMQLRTIRVGLRLRVRARQFNVHSRAVCHAGAIPSVTFDKLNLDLDVNKMIYIVGKARECRRISPLSPHKALHR